MTATPSKVYFLVNCGRALVLHAEGDMADFLRTDDHSIYGFGPDDEYDLPVGVYVAEGEPRTWSGPDPLEQPDFEYNPKIRACTRIEYEGVVAGRGR